MSTLVGIPFCRFRNTCHRLDCLDGILPARRLTTQHQCVSMTVDGIGNIGHFCTGRTGIGDHRMQHLGSHDNRFLLQDALVDDAALDAWNQLDRHLNAQVAACNHDSVRSVDDLINIVNTLLVLNLRDDFDIRVVLVKYLLNLLHIGSGTDEGVGDEVDVLLDRQQDITLVFLRQRRQFDVFAGNIHTLMRTEVTFVLHLCHQHRTVILYHLHVQCTVIKKDMVAHLHIPCEIRIGHIDYIL